MKTFLTYTISILAVLVAGLQLFKAHLDKKSADEEKRAAVAREEKQLAALNKISLEKDAALVELKNTQEKFAALSQYSSELDDRLRYVLCGFEFDSAIPGNALVGTTVLIRFPEIGGVFTFEGLPTETGNPPTVVNAAFRQSCWRDGDASAKPVVKIEQPSVDAYSRVALDLFELGRFSGGAKATILRDLHRHMIEIYANERMLRLAKRFVVIANDRVVMSLSIRPQDWEKKADTFWTKDFASGMYHLNLANNEGAMIPMLLFDLHSSIPPRAE